MPTVADVSGPAASAEVCAECGHNWGDHLMHPKTYPYPTDGWISCPVPGCSCRLTWSVSDHARPMFEASRDEFFKKVAEGGPLPDGVGMDLWYYRLREQQWRDYESRSESGGWLRDLDALYIFGTIGTEAILRGNGEVWVRTDDGWDDPTGAGNRWRPANEHERRASLVIASQQIPELRSLLPTRSPNTRNCTRCSGSGWLMNKVICPDCDGLGWIALRAT